MKEININTFDEKLYYEKLDNGLEVFLIPLPNNKSYYVSLTVRFGGSTRKFLKDNKEYTVKTGIAHFLEHKLFEREDNPFNFYIKSGTDVNASTNSDNTTYYFAGNNNINENLKYLLEWITTFNITEEQVEKEKGIILEEASMYKDVPDRILYEKVLKNVFVNHPYKYKTIGTDEDIKNITKEELELCYENFYRPDNMVLVAAGAINKDDFIKIIRQELRDYKNPTNNVTVKEIYEPDKVSQEYEEINMKVEMPKIAIAYKINKDLFKDLNLDTYHLDYYLQLILSIAFGSTSAFTENLYIDKTILSLTYELLDTENHYIISFFTKTDKEKEFFDKFYKYINNLNPTKNEFDRTIKTWIASEVRLIDMPIATAKNVLYDWIDYKEFKNNKIKDLRNLKYEMLLKVLKRINLDNKCVVKLDSNNEKTVA